MCVVKQEPDQSASSWMLFGRPRREKKETTFQMEFKAFQEGMLVKHLVNLAMTDSESENPYDPYAEIRLVLVAESPAISCIESMWSLKGMEMHRDRFYTPSSLCTALQQDVHMLSISPQMKSPQMKSPQMKSPQMKSPQMSHQPQQQQQHQQQQQSSQSCHPMHTRSKASSITHH